MKHVLLIVLALAGTARATPIEPLWQTKTHCDHGDLVPWGTDLAWYDAGKLQRIDRAAGTLGKPFALPKLAAKQEASIGWSDGTRLAAVIGDALVIHGGHFFAVVDAKTGALRWQADQGHDAGLPTLHAIAGDVFWIHPSHLGKGDAVTIDRLAIATGKVVWTASAAPDSGQIEWSDTDGTRLYVLTRPDSIGPKNVLAAFEVASGKRLWSIELTGKTPDTGSGGTQGLLRLRVGTTIVYGNGDKAVHVIDGATGAARPDVPLAEPPQSLAADATHLYVRLSASLLATDSVKHATLWTQNRTVERLIAATPAALYVVDHDFELLHALDPKTGGELASWGVAGTDLVFEASDGAAPTFVACDDGKRLIALDPTGATTAVEHATITGTLVCTNCKKKLPELAVALGDATGKTDKHGKFKLELDARGALTLGFDLPPLESPIGWAGATHEVVRLTGKKTYSLGTLKVKVDCGPLEPPCQ